VQFDSVLVGRFSQMYGTFAGSDGSRCPSDIDSFLEQNEQELKQSCAQVFGYDRAQWEAVVNTVMKLSCCLIRKCTVSFGLFCHKETSVIRGK
jgi:hypothetical protein